MMTTIDNEVTNSRYRIYLNDGIFSEIDKPLDFNEIW